MSRLLRAAVVGIGYLGRFHAQKYAAMEGVELVGLADVDPDCAEPLARQLNTRAYTQYERLLGKVDAVSVVVPTASHHEVARAFLESGSDVLVEKPMTSTLAQADDLIRCAEKQGRILQVGHLERFNPAAAALWEDIEGPLFIETRRLSPYKPRGTDVSVVLDLMIHDIDLVLQVMRSEPIEVRAAGATVVGPHLDMASARLAFENGCVADLAASRVSLDSLRRMTVYDRSGYLSVDFGEHRTCRVTRDSGPGGGPGPGLRLTPRTLAAGDALRDEIAAFVSAVTCRRPPVVSGRMGRQALGVALEIEALIRTGPAPAGG